MAIQNILASTAFAGCSGCARTPTTDQLDENAPVEQTRRESGTHAAALKHPERRPVVVDLVPEPQADEDPTRHVAHRPEVEREEDDDEDRLRAGERAMSALDSWASSREREGRTEKT